VLSADIETIITDGIKDGKETARISGEVTTCLINAGVDVTPEIEIDIGTIIKDGRESGDMDISFGVLLYLNLHLDLYLNGFFDDDEFMKECFAGSAAA
jgi:hypothetical protein